MIFFKYLLWFLEKHLTLMYILFSSESYKLRASNMCVTSNTPKQIIFLKHL